MVLWQAVLSGLCGSLASTFGKLSGSDFPEFDYVLRYVVKILCFCGMIFLNSLMWTLFVKALHKSKTTVEATAVSSAANYIFSGFLGFLLFQEVLSLFWWCGITCIISGIFIMNENNSIEETKKHKR